MKSFQYFAVILLVSCIIVSCGSDKNVRIGFLLPNLTDVRYPKDRDFFTSKIAQLGGSVEFAEARNDAHVQEEQAIQMIQKGVKVIVIAAVNQNLAASIVRYAHDKGVKVIAYERLIQNCDLDYFVAFDHFVVGKEQAGYAIQKKDGGNYVLLGGDKGDKNAELIKQGQHEILAPVIKSGKINSLYDIFVEDWSAESAYIEMKKALVLSGQKVDVVISANDGMIAGIRQALDEEQRGYPVVVIGMDADPDACQRIVEGKQTMTVFKSFRQQAEIAAQLAINLARENKIDKVQQSTFNKSIQVPTILLQPVVVDSTNVKSTVLAETKQK